MSFDEKDTTITPANSPMTVDPEKENPEINTMSEETKKASKTSFLGDSPLLYTMWILTYPDLVEKLAEAAYSVVDSMFIGNLAGDTEEERNAALASISYATPLVQGLIFGICLFYSIGSGAMYSRSLGKGCLEDAKSVIYNFFILCLCTGIIIPFVYWGISNPLLRLLGASEKTNTLQSSQIYFIIISSGILFYIFSIGGSTIIRNEGSALFSACILITGFIVNIVLDPLLIGIAKMGVTGAAIATISGYGLSALCCLFYFILKKSAVTLKFKEIRPHWKLMKPVLNIGISGFCSAFSTAVLNSVTNRLILYYSPYGSDSIETTEAIAVSGAIGKITYFCFLPMLSISTGMMPILSYCRGAKLYTRHMNCMKVAFLCSITLALLLTIIGFFSAEYIGKAFGGSEGFLNVFTPAMRYVTSGLVFCPFVLIMYPTLQCCGYGITAAILIVCKQCVFYIVIQVIVCEIRHDYWGCFIAYPISDFLSAILGIIVFFCYRKDLDGSKDRQKDYHRASSIQDETHIDTVLK
ncbi:hypothetical protein WA158_000650 [Blastocystis sp. Blastoise]